MKIYTLTFNCPDRDNYGQILQSFALIRFTVCHESDIRQLPAGTIIIKRFRKYAYE